MNVLCVCLGNICRSPTAEAVLRHLGPGWQYDSAGTGAWHVGEAPYPPMQRAARARGYELAGQIARQFTADDFDRFDVILAMDPDNFAAIEAQRPAGCDTPVYLFANFADEDENTVSDPYYTRDFDATLDMIEAAADVFLTEMQYKV